MLELVHLEVVAVESPGAVEDVVLDGFQGHAVDFLPVRILRVHQVGVNDPAVHVEERLEAQDIPRRDRIALAVPLSPRQNRRPHVGGRGRRRDQKVVDGRHRVVDGRHRSLRRRGGRDGLRGEARTRQQENQRDGSYDPRPPELAARPGSVTHPHGVVPSYWRVLLTSTCRLLFICGIRGIPVAPGVPKL